MTREDALVVMVAYLQTGIGVTIPDWPSFREATKKLSEEAKNIHDRENAAS